MKNLLVTIISYIPIIFSKAIFLRTLRLENCEPESSDDKKPFLYPRIDRLGASSFWPVYLFVPENF